MSFDGITKETTSEVIANDGFYPALAAQDFINIYHAPSNFLGELIIEQIALAMIHINGLIAPFAQCNWDEYETLDKVPALKVNNKSVLISHYQKAVFSRAKAKLLLSKQSIDQRDVAKAQQQDLSDNEAYWLNESLAAVNAMTAQKYQPFELL